MTIKKALGILATAVIGFAAGAAVTDYLHKKKEQKETGAYDGFDCVCPEDVATATCHGSNPLLVYLYAPAGHGVHLLSNLLTEKLAMELDYHTKTITSKYVSVAEEDAVVLHDISKGVLGVEDLKKIFADKPKCVILVNNDATCPTLKEYLNDYYGVQAEDAECFEDNYWFATLADWEGTSVYKLYCNAVYKNQEDDGSLTADPTMDGAIDKVFQLLGGALEQNFIPDLSEVGLLPCIVYLTGSDTGVQQDIAWSIAQRLCKASAGKLTVGKYGTKDCSDTADINSYAGENIVLLDTTDIDAESAKGYFSLFDTGSQCRVLFLVNKNNAPAEKVYKSLYADLVDVEQHVKNIFAICTCEESAVNREDSVYSITSADMMASTQTLQVAEDRLYTLLVKKIWSTLQNKG